MDQLAFLIWQVEYHLYERMLEQMDQLTIGGGQPVFRQGDAATSVYLVSGGTLQVETDPGGKGGEGGSESEGEQGCEGGVKHRVIATLSAGDHFGETALIESRYVVSHGRDLGEVDFTAAGTFLLHREKRNATVRCISPTCELRCMSNERFRQWLRQSPQLSSSVHSAAMTRNNRRVRKVVEAMDEGKASSLRLRPGEILFRQGDLAENFYLVISGEVQMTITPATESLDVESLSTTIESRGGGKGGGGGACSIPMRRSRAGECFGASGLMAEDNRRRYTATAVGEVELKAVPHTAFRVMLRDDGFLRAGLKATGVLEAALQAQQAAGAERREAGIHSINARSSGSSVAAGTADSTCR
jgi:CRP-like cAMP-binding protein